MNYKYLIDSNVLASSSIAERIETDFFRDNCLIVAEVDYELDGTSMSESIRKQQIVRPTTDTLKQLAGITDDLVRLGILKTDHGNGEALLIAEALVLIHSGDEQTAMDFMRTQPVIVTEEKAVDAYAKSIGIKSISGKEFRGILSAIQTV